MLFYRRLSVERDAPAQREVRTWDPTAVELVAQDVFDPTIAYLLMTIGSFAVLIELFHPGALLPGVSGVRPDLFRTGLAAPLLATARASIAYAP